MKRKHLTAIVAAMAVLSTSWASANNEGNLLTAGNVVIKSPNQGDLSISTASNNMPYINTKGNTNLYLGTGEKNYSSSSGTNNVSIGTSNYSFYTSVGNTNIVISTIDSPIKNDIRYDLVMGLNTVVPLNGNSNIVINGYTNHENNNTIVIGGSALAVTTAPIITPMAMTKDFPDDIDAIIPEFEFLNDDNGTLVAKNIDASKWSDKSYIIDETGTFYLVDPTIASEIVGKYVPQLTYQDFHKQNGSVAIGDDSTVLRTNSVVLGHGSNEGSLNNLQDIPAITSGKTSKLSFNEYMPATTPVHRNDITLYYPNDNDTGLISIGSDTIKRQLVNVGAGEVSATSTDGINGSQLYATNTITSNVATSSVSSLSDASTLGTDGTITTNLTVDGITYHTVEDALQAFNNRTVDTSNLVNTDLDNLTNTGKTKIKNLAQDAVKVVDGTNTTVTSTTDGDTISYAVNVTDDSIRNAMQTELDKKANKDASNLTSSDVNAWREVLDINNGDSLVKTDGTTVTIDRNGSAGVINMSYMVDGQPVDRVLTGVETDLTNPSSVVNVNTLTNRIQSLDNTLQDDIDHAGAVSAALAALHPLSYDPSSKWNIAIGQGRYNGNNATAIGAFYQPNENTMFNISGTVSGKESAINAGLTIRFGRSSKQKRIQQRDVTTLINHQNALKDGINALQHQIDALTTPQHITLDTHKKKPFPDIPSNHWAKEQIEILHGNDILEGYPDGEFKGDRTMTRYEYSQMFYKTLK